MTIVVIIIVLIIMGAGAYFCKRFYKKDDYGVSHSNLSFLDSKNRKIVGSDSHEDDPIGPGESILPVGLVENYKINSDDTHEKDESHDTSNDPFDHEQDHAFNSNFCTTLDIRDQRTGSKPI